MVHSGSALTPSDFDPMSPNARVLANPESRSSPKESVIMEPAAKRRRRDDSRGLEAWWLVVSATGAPSDTRERRMRVSPTWAVVRVAVVEGCQNGVGVGVEMRAMEAVEPPRKGAVGMRVWGKGEEGVGCEESWSLMGRSVEEDEWEVGSFCWAARRSWVRRKLRSVERKA